MSGGGTLLAMGAGGAERDKRGCFREGCADVGTRAAAALPRGKTLRRGELERGADAVLDERIGESIRDGMRRFPARAVGRDEHIGGQVLEGVERVADDRLEERPLR